MIRGNTTSNKTNWYHESRYMMYWGLDIISVAFLPEIHPQANHRKMPGDHKLRHVWQNNWYILFKSIKVLKCKERWETVRDFRRVRRNNKTQCRILNRIPEKQWDINEKTGEIWIILVIGI